MLIFDLQATGGTSHSSAAEHWPLNRLPFGGHAPSPQCPAHIHPRGPRQCKSNTLLKKKIKFFSYIRKFRIEQLQLASSYMLQYLRISSYIRKPFLIYDFVTAPFLISLYCIWGKFFYIFYQCIRRFFTSGLSDFSLLKIDDP